MAPTVKNKEKNKSNTSKRTKSSLKSNKISNSNRSKGRTKNSKNGSRRTPIYALAIMTLMTVIVILVNQLVNEERLFRKGQNSPSTDLITSDYFKEKDFDYKKDDLSVGNKNEPDKIKSDENSSSEKLIKIYLIKFNEKTEMISLTPVARRIKSDFPLRNAMNELIKGPTWREKSRGMLSAVPGNLKINHIKTENRVAIIDFNYAIEEGANGSILLNRIDQIVFTATQFKIIDSVMIKINGKRRKFIGSDGLSIGGSLYRRQM